MSVCWLAIGDGRDDYHEQSIASAKAMLPKPDHAVVIDDSDHRLGFAGAIQAGWDEVLATGAEWIVHLELDFIFHAPVPLDRMVAVLDRHPQLAQLALKRQPWNAEEAAAGGIVELHPDEYEQRTDHGDIWTEHRLFFSTNPSVYSTALCHYGWPQESESEGKFTHRLLEDPGVRFAFWGAKFDPPLVEHLGARSADGHGY